VRCYPNNVLNLCGCTNVGQLAYVLKSAQLCIANDGGTTHLASALGTPTVALIPGIEPPGSVDPYGWDKFSVRHEISCAPCYSFLSCPKGHRQCMLAIPVDHVFQKIVSIFNEYIYLKV
jgi:heptosyltransferase-2